MKYLLLFLLLLSGFLPAQRTCHVPERMHEPPPASLVKSTPSGTLCAEVFVQVDADLVAMKGGVTGARRWAEAYMAEVAVPFGDIDVELTYTYEFLTREQYTNGDSYSLLTQFRTKKPTFTGDLAILLSTKASGGIAYVGPVCTNSGYRYAFASVDGVYKPYREGYSWDVMVSAHELAHGFGANHTHECIYTVDGVPNQAIDGCVSNAGCDRAPIPGGGGTLLSYCHLTYAGINFAKGFHPLVVPFIRTTIYNQCQTCAAPPPPPPPPGDDGVTCTDNPLFINLILDVYPDETRYRVLDASGKEIHTKGPFDRYTATGELMAGEVIADTLCLPDGCYTFEIIDENGLIADGCGEGMFYVGDPFGEFGSGAAFKGKATVPFCFNDTPPPSDCPAIELKNIEPHGGTQDKGTYTLVDGVLTLKGNAWKKMDFDYTVTENTVVQFDFLGTKQGEIQGFGFDHNYSISAPFTFNVWGTQKWGWFAEPEGRPNYKYTTPGQWQTLTIQAGKIIENRAFNRIVFAGDKDGGDRNAEASYRNIRIYEGDCDAATTPRTGAIDTPIRPYPNPTTGVLNFGGVHDYELISPLGSLIATGRGDQLEMSDLTPGLYLIRFDGKVTRRVVKT